MSKSTKQTDTSPVYDARALGRPRMVVLGLQHMFAMFGATVLVPAITGLSVSATLMFAGLGTLLCHLITRWKVPVFLGSSFAFLGAYGLVSSSGAKIPLTYSCVGVMCAGALYLVLAGLIKGYGIKRVMRYFPPIVTGPVIMAIGLTLSGWAFSNCVSNWWIALLAIVTVIGFNIWGKGMTKIVPILLGIITSYTAAAIAGVVDFTALTEAAWIGAPFQFSDTVFSLFGNADSSMLATAIITIMPIALATMVEHIGDICAISSTTNRNYLVDPGLHRTLIGDGAATMLAAAFGAPANTTYSENTGVLGITRVYDPRVIRIAAGFAILMSFCPKFSALISAMPTATLGGVSLILYGMIASIGVRNVVENNVDFSKSRNVIISALILVLAIGIKYGTESGAIFIGSISFSGLATGAIVGILLNAILPGKDYEFGVDLEGDTSASFKL